MLVVRRCVVNEVKGHLNDIDMKLMKISRHFKDNGFIVMYWQC